jgi:hypothetical protein
MYAGFFPGLGPRIPFLILIRPFERHIYGQGHAHIDGNENQKRS